MSFDLSTLESIFLSRLGLTSWADCTWMTQAELYDYFDEAAKHLGSMRVFAEVDSSTELAGATSQYACPTGWISTIAAAANKIRLRPTSVVELEALDSGYQATAGTTITRYSMDAGPLGTITLYPIPGLANAGQPLEQVYHRFPADISTSQTAVTVSAPVADYFLYFALQRARARQSEAEMRDMAVHFGERCSLWEQLFQHYWGGELE